MVEAARRVAERAGARTLVAPYEADAQLAQAAGVRTGFLEADMGALMRPVEGQGMLNPDAARMAAHAPSSGAT